MVTHEEVLEAFGKIKEFCSERDCSECEFDIWHPYYCKIIKAIFNIDDTDDTVNANFPDDWNLEYLKSDK